MTLTNLTYIDTQEAWENELIERGQTAFRSSIIDAQASEYYSSTKPAQYETNNRLADYIASCEVVVADAKEGKKCRNNINLMFNHIESYAEKLSYGVLGVLALKSIFDRYTSKRGMIIAKVATTIGERIEIELRHHHYKSHFCEKDQITIDRWASRPGANPKNRRTATRSISQKIADKNNVPHFQDWRGNHTTRVGLFFIEVAVACGILDWKMGSNGKNRAKMLVLKDELVSLLDTHYENIEARSFRNFPLIEQPKDWHGNDVISRENKTGGYHNEMLRYGLSFARGFDHFSEFGSKAYNLSNTLQATAWRVDNDILDITLWCQEKRHRVGSLLVPTIDRPQKGGAPSHIADDKDALDRWKQSIAQQHTQCNDEYIEGVRARQALEVAKEYRFKTFYHSWSVDYRGRYYPQQAWLHPQTTDFEKALIQFKDGCKIDNGCLDVVQQAVGAAFNGSRISFQEREQWTKDNHEFISLIATHPKSTIHLWEKAKEPWQFLQLAFEYYKVVITKQQKIWHIPVGADATASGLQLLSAMRRDKQGMFYANLMPPQDLSSPPEDAYLAVLGYAKQIATGAVTGAQRATQKKLDKLVYPHLVKYLGWRSVGKPSLMVSLYNGSYRTIRQGIIKALKEEGVQVVNGEYLTFADANSIHYNDTKLLTDIILLSSEMVFPAAFETLRWLYQVFDYATTRAKSRVKWTTPTDDLIHCKVHKVEAEPVYTSHFGKVMVIKDSKGGKGEIDGEKIRAASIPGYVHSYDSSLCKEAFSDWKHPIALTHDCYKCLPNHFDSAQELVRQAFVSIVADDELGRNPLDRLADDLNIPEDKIPKLKAGDGNLSDILKSKYMFN